MRVLVDALTMPGDPRGIGRYVRGLAGAIAEVAPAGPAPETRVLVVHGRWHADFYAPLAARGVELLPIAGRGGGRLARHAWHAAGLPAVARSARADVIHVPDRMPVLATFGPPLVVTVHDVAEYDHPDAFGSLQRRYRRLILDGQLRRARRLVTPSEFSAQRLRRVRPSAAARTSVVHSGPGLDPATEAAAPAIAIPTPFFLCLGAVQRHKNLPRVIRAFRGLAARSAGLVVVGADHNDRDAVSRAAAGDRRIVRLPNASDAEVAWLYRHAVALLFASEYEGFGFPIVEAMAFGCPLLTSDRGAMRELADGAALLVDPLDEPAIRTALARLLDDRALGTHLAEAGRERAARFSWVRAASGMLSVYRDALGGADPCARGRSAEPA
jgi:glycosyltransferase involved in cell wall biosynthesis